MSELVERGLVPAGPDGAHKLTNRGDAPALRSFVDSVVTGTSDGAAGPWHGGPAGPMAGGGW